MNNFWINSVKLNLSLVAKNTFLNNKSHLK